MKVKNFKINIVVQQWEEKSLITVEKDFTIKSLREQMNLPEGCEFFCKWIQLPDCAVIEDWDLIEVKSDVLAMIDKLQKDFVGLVKRVNSKQ